MYTDDLEVIGAVLQGDKDRYAELIQRYKRMVYGIAWSHLGNRDLSEDAAQETFVKAYCYLGALRDPDKFAGWLARIARNVCNTLGRKAKRESEFVEQWAPESPIQQTAEDNRGSLEEQLAHSFAALPAIHREALTIFYIQDKSVRESADILGISETALKARLFRARTALREQLERRLEDSLETLEPSKNFTPSVLALLPLSPKGAVGAGGLLALLGKVSASFSFFLWTGVASSALTSGLMFWYFKAEEANIRDDRPGSDVLKQMLRRTARITIMTMAGAMLIVSLLQSRFDFHAILKVIAVYWAYFGWRMARMLKVDSSPYMISEMFLILVMCGMITAIGFFNAPIITFPITMMVFCVVGFFTANLRPGMVGYNPFAVSAPDQVPGGDLPPVHLSREQLKTFAKLLGRQKLVVDYRFEGDSIILVLPESRPGLWSQLSKRVTTGSTAVVKFDGTCDVHRSDADLKGGRQLAADTHQDAEVLEAILDHMIPNHLKAFIANGCRAASPDLSAQGGESFFKKKPGKLWHRRAIFVFCFVATAWLLVMNLLETGH
ncbi:MAG: RNA polymerase sigma factor [Armatimonadetes bacterium]|nr:RNA polymerase sigma factor [Armatimonadota bacterium]